MNSASLRRRAARIHWLLAEQCGIDLRKLLRLPAGLVRYLRDRLQFRGLPGQTMSTLPCLHDWWEPAGAVSNEYFWQDLFVARMIHSAAPRRHIDVGSRLDGFVAHLACFREVEVYDVRPLSVQIPGIIFRQANLMEPAGLPEAACDSLSCLHALEHFGLGRYGDPLDPDGMRHGLMGLARLLQPEGRLYLAVPAGEDVVHFNAHRALRPGTVTALAAGAGFELEQCWLFDHRSHSFELLAEPARVVLEPEQTLALYILRRSALAERS